ncbi:SWIM zinc finger family protein [Streptomyces sp. Amel2xB2]|uniref:SWIM zinc finger family protein n=1 Tax=Streptomyces sp. Amel2xB2 TaxID=1305829 RepID=UPI000DB946B2|nr:SWIM zinc finger family protein [Streptomyces sp. Amel2xB2]
MTGQGVRWTAEEVLALAPDEASRRAGSKLSSPGPWSESGSGAGAVWGLCKGSGSKPYRTVIDLGGGAGTGEGTDGSGGAGGSGGTARGAGPGYKCSCPSRKFPCKHALGLLLLWAGEQAAPEESPPEWAGEWLSGRRERAAAKSAAANGGSGGGAAGAEGAGAEGGGRRADSEASKRRAERRMRRITAGATELEERLADLLRGGLAGAEQGGWTQWEETASRMVDAQAPGLAARIRELGAVPVSAASRRSEGASGGWPARLLSECALLHLLNRGVLALDDLPEPLAATVRTRVGLTVEAAELLAGGEGRVRDSWLVLAQRDTEEGRLTARRIWLRGRDSGRPALLLSYAAGGRGHAHALPVGSVVDAELAYYPGARPLRAALGEQHTAPFPGPAPEGGTVTDALTAYGAALVDDPWLDAWPAVLSGVVPTLGEGDGGIRQLADGDGEFAVPVASGTSSAALWRLAAVSGGRPVTVFGECGHQGFAPYTVWSEESQGGAVLL